MHGHVRDCREYTSGIYGRAIDTGNTKHSRGRTAYAEIPVYFPGAYSDTDTNTNTNTGAHGIAVYNSDTGADDHSYAGAVHNADSSAHGITIHNADSDGRSWRNDTAICKAHDQDII